jgi:uncharacterized cupin superfamily protein
MAVRAAILRERSPTRIARMRENRRHRAGEQACKPVRAIDLYIQNGSVALNQKSSSANADGVFEPFDISEAPLEVFEHGERFGMSFQHLSSFGGGTQVSVSMEVLTPGKQANQFHYHMLEEEHLLILEGSLTLRLGSQSHVMSAGQYVCFPAGQAVGHALFNHTSQPCRYLVFGNPQAHDVVVFPDSGRVSVRLMDENYRKSARMEYWDNAGTTGPT